MLSAAAATCWPDHRQCHPGHRSPPVGRAAIGWRAHFGWFVVAGAASGGTVAYWRFEEGRADSPASGSFSALDSSGNGLDGTPINGPGTLDDRSGGMRLYINGVQRALAVTSVRPVGAMDANSNPGIGIGNVASGNYNEYFNGLIDEVRISDRALAPSQLLSAASLPGDANRDGKVDFSDLLILAQHYGRISLATWADGDFNGDASVGFDDLLILAQHYGQPLTPAQAARLSPAFAADVRSAFSQAPDPGIGSCVVAGLMLVAQRRHERNG